MVLFIWTPLGLQLFFMVQAWSLSSSEILTNFNATAYDEILDDFTIKNGGLHRAMALTPSSTFGIYQNANSEPDLPPVPDLNNALDLGAAKEQRGPLGGVVPGSKPMGPQTVIRLVPWQRTGSGSTECLAQVTGTTLISCSSRSNVSLKCCFNFLERHLSCQADNEKIKAMI